jgi:hypothetical protein
MPGPDDLSPEVRALLGTPCSEEPCDACGPSPNITCQLSRDATAPVWVPAQIVNADAGHLIMVPSDGVGQIGGLLAALLPAQHYSHEAMMIKDRFELRHCTSSADYLKAHPYMSPGAIVSGIDDNPTDGFTEDAMRYGWPGTVTQSVEEAYRASRNQNDGVVIGYNGPGSSGLGQIIGSTKKPSTILGDDLPIEGMDFEPVMVPVALPADAEALLQAIIDGDKSPDDLQAISRSATVTWQMMWPLVVRPCPHNSKPHIQDALRRVAAAADYLASHYRYHAYLDGRMGEDHRYDGPTMNDTSRPDPASPCSAPKVWDHSIALVSSVFLWEAVQEANRQGLGPEIQLTHPFDHQPAHNCVPYYGAGGGDVPSQVDGLFEYNETQTTRAAVALAASIMRDIESSENAFPWWLSWIGDLYEAFSDISNDVANQVCNAFAFDRCDPLDTKDDDSWRHPPPSTSVSPDNIIRSWMAPLTQDPGPEIQGLYGYNMQLVLRPGHFEQRRTRVWAYSEGPATVQGRVLYNKESAVGARVTLACKTTYTNVEGWYTLEVPAGRYELEGTLYVEQPQPQPAWCADGRVEVEFRAGAQTLPDLILTDPPGENRIVQITGHADLVNRHTFGKDWWDHPRINLKQVHLGNYFTDEGNQQTVTWGSTIDDNYGVGVEVKASRAAGTAADPYPVDLHVKATLGAKGVAGWPFTPDAVEEFDVHVATDGSASSTIDLKTGAIAPVRAHLELSYNNYRQG